MSDLIERLRDFADGPRCEGMPIAADAMLEAADTIESLRAENARLTEEKEQSA